MLAILATHPIQYQVPIWKALATRARIPFRVLYMSEQGVEASVDPGFGRSLAWDIDLLGGYDSTFLDTIEGPRRNSFWWQRLKPGFAGLLQEMGARALWIQGWQVAAYWQAAHAARRAGIPVWLRGETNLRSRSSGPRSAAKRMLLGQFLGWADRFLAIGAANRAFYRAQGIAPERIVSAPYCVDNARFAAQAEALGAQRARLRERWRIPADAFCFLFVGKFVPKKRPLDLARAAGMVSAKARPIHILWVGSGELGAEVRAGTRVMFDADGSPPDADRSQSAGVAASFAGFLNQTEISEAYVAADCLVLPSTAQETWGLVVNEAMASGLPAIVSDACGCADDLVAPLRPDLSFPTGDVAALARAMESVMADPPSPAALAAHIDGYDYMRTVETVERLYEEIPSAGVAARRVLARA